MSDAGVEYLDVEDLVDLAGPLLGNPPPIRDMGLLGSAAARPQTTVFGEDAYPDIRTKAAALQQSVVKNRALVVGVDSRHATNDDVYELFVGIVAGAGTIEELVIGLRAPTLSYDAAGGSRVPHEGHHAGGRPRSDSSAANSRTWTVQDWRRRWARIASTMKCSRSSGVWP